MSREKGIPKVEWIVAAAGFVLVFGVIALLLVEAARGRGEPPRFELTALETRRAAGAFAVELEVENHGDEHAAAVEIGAEGDAATVTIDYLPAGSKRRATLLFARDPGSLPPLRVLGHRPP